MTEPREVEPGQTTEGAPEVDAEVIKDLDVPDDDDDVIQGGACPTSRQCLPSPEAM